MNRRQALKVIGSVALISTAGCISEGESNQQQTTTNSNTDSGLELTNTGYDHTEYGNLYVYGTGRNVTNQVMDYVQVEGQFIDFDNRVMESGYDNISNLQPKQEWNIKIMYSGTNEEDVSSFKFVESVTY